MICKRCTCEKPKSEFYSRDTTCKECRRKQYRDRYADLSPQDRENRKLQQRRALQERNVKLRDEIYAAYGGACSCCGETEPAFLTIDHVNGRSSADDKRGIELYRYLKELGFPDGYRILCFNCNSGRERNGGICPHELARVNA